MMSQFASEVTKSIRISYLMFYMDVLGIHLHACGQERRQKRLDLGFQDGHGKITNTTVEPDVMI